MLTARSSLTSTTVVKSISYCFFLLVLASTMLMTTKVIAQSTTQLFASTTASVIDGDDGAIINSWMYVGSGETSYLEFDLPPMLTAANLIDVSLNLNGNVEYAEFPLEVSEIYPICPIDTYNCTNQPGPGNQLAEIPPAGNGPYGADITTNLLPDIVTDIANGKIFICITAEGPYPYTLFGLDQTDESYWPCLNITTTIPLVPVANNDAYSVAEGSTLSVSATGVSANDTSPDGGILSASKCSDVNNGSLILNSDGSFSYTPSAGFWGTDSFTYKASEVTTAGTIVSAPATVTITVNSIPVANNYSYTMLCNSSLVLAPIGALTNDTTADGGELRAPLDGRPLNGTVTLISNGSFTYTPTTGFTGTDSFTYYAIDGASHSASPGKVTITVNCLQSINALIVGSDYNLARAGIPTTGTVILNAPAPMGGLIVTLSSSDPSVTFNQTQLVFDAGSSSENFTIDNTSNGNMGLYGLWGQFYINNVISATLNGNTTSSPLLIMPPYYNMYLSTSSMNWNLNDDYTVTTGGLSLNYYAYGIYPGMLYFATDNEAVVQNAASMQIGGPDESTIYLDDSGYGTIQPYITPVLYPTIAHLSLETEVLGSFGTGYATINVVPPTPNSISITPSSVVGGVANQGLEQGNYQILTTGAISAAGTVSLNGVTPSSGVPINFSSSDSSVSVPCVTQTGASSNQFPIYTTAVACVKNVIITASNFTTPISGNPPTAIITVNPPGVTSISFSPASVTGGTTTQCTVTFSGPTPDKTHDHLLLSLSSDNTAAVSNIKRYVHNGGATSYTFPFSTNAVTSSSTVNVTATVPNDPLLASVTAQLTVIPPVLASVTLTNNVVSGNDADLNTGVVTLNGPAPTGGLIVNLASQNDDVLVPASVLIEAGVSSASFNIQTTQVNDIESDIITATMGTVTQNVTLIVVTPFTPIVQNQSYTNFTEHQLTITAENGLLQNAVNPNGTVQSLITSPSVSPTNGTITINSDGSFTYQPNNGFSGTDTFSYIATAAGPYPSYPATVTITVNSIPIANPSITYHVLQNQNLVVSPSVLLGNRSDDEAGNLTTALVQAPNFEPTFILNPDGSFNYISSTIGSDSFTYTVNNGTDSNGTSDASSICTVNIIVAAPITTINAGAISYTTPADTWLIEDTSNLLQNENDPNGVLTTAVLLSGTAHGFLAFNYDWHNVGSFIYTPEANFVGTDSFTYAVSDGCYTSNSITVTIIVGSSPVALPAYYGASPNCANYTKSEAFPFGFSSMNTVSSLLEYHSAFNFCSGNPTGDWFWDNILTYLSDVDTNGKVQGVLFNDTDPNGLPLSIASTNTSNMYGSVTMFSDGTFIYTAPPTVMATINGVPHSTNNWQDSFYYTATDGVNQSQPAKVTINVGAPPTAQNYNLTCVENSSLMYATPGVLAINANGYDPNTNIDPIINTGNYIYQQMMSAMKVCDPAYGTLTFNADGSFVYTPNGGFSGTDQFEYVAINGVAMSNIATVTITITQP